MGEEVSMPWHGWWGLRPIGRTLLMQDGAVWIEAMDLVYRLTPITPYPRRARVLSPRRGDTVCCRGLALGMDRNVIERQQGVLPLWGRGTSR